MAIASWSLVRVYGTWTDAKGNMLSGTYKISVPARLTNSTDDLIIPAGTYDSGALNTTPGVPSLSVLCPSTDDPDIQQDNWKLTVEITLNGGRAAEKYTLDVPIANRPVVDGGNGIGVNLRTIMLAANTPPQVAMYGVGVAGGLAILSNDGTAVLDKDGNPISTGGGGTGAWADITGKPSSFPPAVHTHAASDISDSTATGRSVLTAADAAAARAAIGAGASNLALGSTSSTAAAGDHTHSGYAASSHTHTASAISDSTTVGRAVLVATDATAARTAIGAGTSSLALGTTSSTAAAGDHTHTGFAAIGHTHTAANVTDFTTAALAAAPAETATSTGALINGATAKATPVDADMVGIADSAASNVLKKLTWANVKATLKTYFDTLYAAVGHAHSAADITSGSLALARNTASIPHDVWQASGGAWPARPSVPTGARVNWIGYPGLTSLPGDFSTGVDSYTYRAA